MWVISPKITPSFVPNDMLFIICETMFDIDGHILLL
jgi:hypothetical protein